MVAILDILQSIPVLSFLPGVMLAMVSLFPDKQVGVELGSIILIFTGQVWNMAFSFYSSLKSIPRELREASSIYRFGKWQRFFQLELPYGAIGLIWNSIVSVAGGWFFLMACEMFVLGKRDFRLARTGLLAADRRRTTATRASMLWGLAAMIGGHSSDRPARLAAGHRVVEQVQVRAGGKRAGAHISASCTSCEIRTRCSVFREKTIEPLSEKLSLYFARRETGIRSAFRDRRRHG